MTATRLPTVSTLQARTTVHATSQGMVIMAVCVQVFYAVVRLLFFI